MKIIETPHILVYAESCPRHFDVYFKSGDELRGRASLYAKGKYISYASGVLLNDEGMDYRVVRAEVRDAVEKIGKLYGLKYVKTKNDESPGCANYFYDVPD